MAACPRCNADNPAGSISCRACGAALSGTLTRATASNVRPRVFIRIVRADGGPEAVVPMKGEVLTCGRKGDLAIPDDPFVAPAQARFFFSGSRLALEDVGGANGVFVRLREEREVPTGGELRLGRQRLLLEPIAALSTAADGGVRWGSPDPGYRYRLLQILEGGLRGAAYPLKLGENLLGRETGEISFPSDGFVSGRHAVVRVTPERVTIRDVGSSNGTFARLTSAIFVENGDQLLIGRELLRVEIQPGTNPAIHP